MRFLLSVFNLKYNTLKLLLYLKLQYFCINLIYLYTERNGLGKFTINVRKITIFDRNFGIDSKYHKIYYNFFYLYIFLQYFT